MDVFTHLVKGSIELIQSHTKITDLDEHSFHHILEYLSLQEVFLSRRVNKFFLRQIDSYLENYRHFTYDCKMNGTKMFNGEYLFDGLTLDFMLSKMPNVRVMKFEKCPEMRGALATTTFDIIRSLANNLVMLNELHITRTRALNRSSLQLLVDWFPNLTHLTMTVYNETLVEIVTKGLANLKYFNLDDSVLDNYGRHLEHLGLKIHTLIAAPDHNNHKNSIVDGLLKGNGRYLRELEMRVKAYDSDQTLFDTIGQEFCDLTSLKLSISSRRTFANSRLLSGLGRLCELKTLHLEERKIIHQFYTSLDDESILSIMKGCPRLENLVIISGGKGQQINDSAVNCVTDHSLSMIHELLPNIRFLSLKSVEITDKTLDSIEKLRKLRTLRLDSLSSVSSSGLQNFMINATQINRLEVINCLNHN